LRYCLAQERMVHMPFVHFFHGIFTMTVVVDRQIRTCSYQDWIEARRNSG
jgi:hypothetical protein